MAISQEKKGTFSASQILDASNAFYLTPLWQQ